MEITINILLSILYISLLYIGYQLYRNNKIYIIRIKWINSKDKRFDKYTYEFMHDPNKHNWWGLKYPKDKHYK